MHSHHYALTYKNSVESQKDETLLDQLLSSFLKLEAISQKLLSSPEDELAEKMFVETTQILKNGTF